MSGIFEGPGATEGLCLTGVCGGGGGPGMVGAGAGVVDDGGFCDACGATVGVFRTGLMSGADVVDGFS